LRAIFAKRPIEARDGQGRFHSGVFKGMPEQRPSQAHQQGANAILVEKTIEFIRRDGSCDKGISNSDQFQIVQR
jgi:hypothetical protein